MLDVADSDDRDLDCCSDIMCKMAFPAFLEIIRFNDRSTGIIGTAADVDIAYTEGFKVFSLSNSVCFVNAVFQVVTSVHTDTDREAGTAHHLNAFDDLCHKAHSSFEAAAVFISTLIGMRGKELGYQIAMGCVDLDTVSACFLGNDCTEDKLFDHCFDFFCCQSTWLFTDDSACNI